MQRPGTRWLRGVVLSALAWPLAACGPAEVELPSVEVAADEQAACESIVAGVPTEIGDRERVPVVPVGGLGAAWGDPAIVMTCGGVPPEISRTAQCQEVNGVGWYVEPDEVADASRNLTLVTVGYRPIVTVTVPADERPEGATAAMAELSASVEANADLIQPCL